MAATELSGALKSFESVACQVSELKKETMEKEAAVLTAILERVKPLVPFVSKEAELYYRRALVIVTNYEKTPLEEAAYFYSERQLILYENGLLTQVHRYGEFSPGHRPGWESRDEEEISTSAAIAAFGFGVIVKGLAQAFEAAAPTAQKEELEGSLKALAAAMGVLR